MLSRKEPKLCVGRMALRLLAYAAFSRSGGSPVIRCLLHALRTHSNELLQQGLHPAVLHIGANLAFGNHNDPIRDLYDGVTISQVQFVLVEPQSRIASRLRNMTRNMPMVHVENAVVCAEADSGQDVPFYEIDMDKVAAMKKAPIFFVKNGQVASLNRSHIVDTSRRFVPEIDSLIRQIKLPCLSVASVLRRYSIGSRDLAGLIIDAEGYDATILASINWMDAWLRPKVLVFERLGMTSGVRASLENRLRKELGYSCSSLLDAENIWCEQTGGRPTPSLTRAPLTCLPS